jgi:hypothetical protein
MAAENSEESQLFFSFPRIVAGKYETSCSKFQSMTFPLESKGDVYGASERNERISRLSTSEGNNKGNRILWLW